MKVRYTPRALSDLEAIFSFLDRHSPASALHIKRLIVKLAEGLADFPEAGLAADLGARALLVGRFPCRIFYRIGNDEIHILHIRHTSRRPWQGGED